MEIDLKENVGKENVGKNNVAKQISQKRLIQQIKQPQRILLIPLLALLLSLSLTLCLSVATALAQSPCGDTVTVVAGDTLRAIATRCNTTVAAILASNAQITNRNLIYVGQVLNIPSPEDVTPGEPAVLIDPDSGPPGSVVNVSARNYPPNTELVMGLGAPASEPTISVSTTTNISGTATAQVRVPADAQPNQRFVVVAYVPGPGNARATSQAFITTSGQDGASVMVTPDHGPAGAHVRLQATGVATNTLVEIGFGRLESEYDIIAQAISGGDGTLDRQVQVPSFADPSDRYVFVVSPAGATADTISNIFTVTTSTQTRDPQVSISPQFAPVGSRIQIAVSGFPPHTRISYGLGAADGQLLDVHSARTNRSGSVQATLQAPAVEPDAELAVTAFVPQAGGASATSDRITITDEQDEDGQSLFTHTTIYLIALEDAGQSGIEIGCGDSVVPVAVTIEPTVAPLTAALETLLAIDERFYGESGLYNPLYQSDLALDRIDIISGVASIYLSGDLQVGGVCDEPRVRAQIEETALQYYTVNEVQIFVDGEPLAFGPAAPAR